jgi:hypothetical protein
MNLDAQEDFIVRFIAPLFGEADGGQPPLSRIQSMHFTRIFNPDRDHLGAYVRLRVFCATDDTAAVVGELESRLQAHFGVNSGLQRRRQNLDWEGVSREYGGVQVSDVFRDHLSRTSRTVSDLLVLKQAGIEVEPLLWPWTHFFFNAARGYGRSVLELAQGAVTGFVDNV